MAERCRSGAAGHKWREEGRETFPFFFSPPATTRYVGEVQVVIVTEPLKAATEFSGKY